MKDMYNPRL